jgi:hypothetical protein
MGRACSTIGSKMNACKILVGKPEGKRPPGGLRRRGVNNNKMDLKTDRMGSYGLDRFGSR